MLFSIYHSLALFYNGLDSRKESFMATVRKDNKGRRLLNGESQRKDGKYEFKYQDVLEK